MERINVAFGRDSPVARVRFFTAVASPWSGRTRFIQSTESKGITMNIVKSLKNVAVDFSREEDGAQVVEYALVIALVAIGLASALKLAFSGDLGFTALAGRIKDCFAAAATATSC
jgi:pilus assembly protein Flp/PilA